MKNNNEGGEGVDVSKLCSEYWSRIEESKLDKSE